MKPENPHLQRFEISDIKGSEAIKFFETNGYLIISNFFSGEILERFKLDDKGVINAQLDKANEGLMDKNSDLILSEGIKKLEAIDHDHVAQMYDTIFNMPSFFRICGDLNIENAILSLLRLEPESPLYGFTNRCRIDPPRDDRRTYGWHQEVFYTIPYGNYIQTWAPLIYDATIQNGTIQIAAGSHVEGIANQSWIESPGKATQILIDNDVISKYPQISVEMKVGEMMFFSGFLGHRSGTNVSDEVRYSLVGMYHDIGHKPFHAPKIDFEFRKISPKKYFESIFDK